MRVVHIDNQRDLKSEIGQLAQGDCIEVDQIAVLADSAKDLFSALAAIDGHGADFVSLREGIDTRGGQGAALFSFCRALSRSGQFLRRRDGIERAREEGRYKGRKAIAVDEELFDAVISLWQRGDITAREAMKRLNLKPNTFYRRIKEREEQKIKDYKKIGQEIKSEIREAAKQSRRDLGELKKQVKAEAREIRKTADEEPEINGYESKLRSEQGLDEAEHQEAQN